MYELKKLLDRRDLVILKPIVTGDDDTQAVEFTDQRRYYSFQDWGRAGNVPFSWEPNEYFYPLWMGAVGYLQSPCAGVPNILRLGLGSSSSAASTLDHLIVPAGFTNFSNFEDASSIVDPFLLSLPAPQGLATDSIGHEARKIMRWPSIQSEQGSRVLIGHGTFVPTTEGVGYLNDWIVIGKRYLQP